MMRSQSVLKCNGLGGFSAGTDGDVFCQSVPPKRKRANESFRIIGSNLLTDFGLCDGYRIAPRVNPVEGLP